MLDGRLGFAREVNLIDIGVTKPVCGVPVLLWERIIDNRDEATVRVNLLELAGLIYDLVRALVNVALGLDPFDVDGDSMGSPLGG